VTTFEHAMPRLLLIPTAEEACLLLGDRSARTLAAAAGHPCPVHVNEITIHTALCGFGLAAAGAGASHAAARLAAQGGVSGLCLVGIAGTYDPDRAPVGSAIVGTAATCWGIGVGEGAAHRSAAALGWRQAWGDAQLALECERLELTRPPISTAVAGEILSVTAASASAEDAARHRATNSAALAEDMESFAVALAARLHGLPLTVVRGMSNVAGDRDKASWRMPEALASARRLLIAILSPPESMVQS
jgi:futalosine hydrolase